MSDADRALVPTASSQQAVPTKGFDHGEKMITCPTCEGLGEWDEGPLPATSPVQESPDYRQVKCGDCDGEGQILSDRTTEELRAYWAGAIA